MATPHSALFTLLHITQNKQNVFLGLLRVTPRLRCPTEAVVCGVWSLFPHIRYSLKPSESSFCYSSNSLHEAFNLQMESLRPTIALLAHNHHIGD